MSDPNNLVDGQAQEEPAFLDDDGSSAEIPPFITTTNARELYGLREGETVAEAIARSHDAMQSDPARAVTIDQVRERLASEHVKRQGTKKIVTIDEMNEAAAAGWADEVKEFVSVWDAIEVTPEAAAEMKRRSAIMMALQEHITSVGMTELEAAKLLGVEPGRVSDLVRGKFSQFGLDELVRMAVAAGLTVSHEVLTSFDAAEWLTSDEAISAFLSDAEEAGDAEFIAHAREIAERARAINQSKKSKCHR